MDPTQESSLIDTVVPVIPALIASYVKTPSRTSALTGDQYTSELLNTTNPSRFHEVARMSRPTFHLLIDKLQQYGLASSTKVSAAEKMLICLHILTGFSNRAAQERFQHSGETISRIMGEVLHALGRLQNDYITQNLTARTPSAIRRNPKWFPFFENCVGTIDGTHIPASVPSSSQSRFRDRNGDISQNVFAACSFDMRFSFVLAGWEGSAHDGRVLSDAYTKGFRQLHGRYYVGDAGYALSPCVLTPYRGVRYHLKEFKKAKNRPRNMQELFNLRHASCRSVIVVKKRFPILVNMPAYQYARQVEIVLATFLLNNFIRTHRGFTDEYDDITQGSEQNQFPQDHDAIDEAEDNADAADMRDRIAADMWASYTSYLRRCRTETVVIDMSTICLVDIFTKFVLLGRRH
ncbi:hypothetical protein LEN26_008540 [Aphanomyces euteiches]|nr:hypothetical protein AeMF1_005046 [Aphanomyces euteiches]KAH9130424.1 hypothetical protein LEN26_008540 [Aphanomyces euteiches]KAH9189477.1 hypothetical protein AeNC1_008549 [Aphanomyces euteiches]